MSLESHQENRELRQDTKQELRDLRSRIDIEQSRILDRGNRAHNKRYDEKLERNDDVLIGKVDAFVERAINTDAVSPTRKVAMLQEVLGVLNNYIRGLDGASTGKNRTADRLSGIIDRFNKEIRTARDVMEFREGGSRPAQIITEQLPDLSESVETGREIYTVRPGDSLTKIVKDHFGIDWRTSPAASFAVVRLLNDKCRIDDTRSDPNKILAGSHLDFGKARKLLGPDGQPTVEHKDGAIAWYNSIPSTIKNGWTIEDNKNVD